jgi:membrane protease YdiL (CAAX protease family)
MKWIWPKMWDGERGGWWRFAVTTTLFAGSVVLGIVLFTAAMLGGLKNAINNEPAHIQEVMQLIGTVLITGLGLTGLLIGIRFVHHKPIRCIFTDGRPFRLGFAVQSAVLWAVLWFAGTIMLPNGWQLLVRRFEEVPLAWWPVLAVAMFCAMAVGRTAEEIVFRGYLLTRVAAWVRRPWLAVCISTIVFTLIHHGNAAAYTAIALFGIAFGAACIRAGTLAPMIGLHTAHDTLEVLWHPKETNAGATWLDVAFIGVALSIWFGWLLWATRTPPNKSPEPTAVGAGRSAVAVHVASRRWLSFFR